MNREPLTPTYVNLMTFPPRSWLEHAFLTCEAGKTSVDKSACPLLRGDGGVRSKPTDNKLSDDNSRFDIDEASPSGVFRGAIMNKGWQNVFSWLLATTLS